MDALFLTNLVLWYGVFLFSTTVHEAMHSYAAARGGDPTAYQAGLATLNPLPHIKRSPFGMVVVPVVVFLLNHGNWMIGWASSPFNPYWAARHPRRSFVMSLAGPFSHLVLLLLAALLLFGLAAAVPQGSQEAHPVVWALGRLLAVLFELNVILFLFNIIPVPPLDGSEVWFLFIRSEEERLRWRMTFHSYSFIGILFAWWLFREFFVYLYAIAMFLVPAERFL